MKNIVISLLFSLTLLLTTACNDDVSSAKKCSAQSKCESGKCGDSAKKETSHVEKKSSSEEKCGEGKCG